MSENIVEAILFSSSKPMSIADIAVRTGTDVKSARKLLKNLIRRYEKMNGAVQIGKVGSKYVMCLKLEYAKYSEGMPEIPEEVLKTAALIAYYQPIKQKELQTISGVKIYNHVNMLSEKGLIRKRKKGNTFILTTTKKFCEYFGIPCRKRDDIKKWFANRYQIEQKTMTTTPEQLQSPLQSQQSPEQLPPS